MSQEKPGLWPGNICLTRTSASPGSSLICLTKYELSKIPDLKDLDFFQPRKGVQYLAPEACQFGTPLPTVNGYDKIRSGQTTQTKPSKGSHKKIFWTSSKDGRDKVKTRSGQVHGKVNARSRRGEGKVERQGQVTINVMVRGSII